MGSAVPVRSRRAAGLFSAGADARGVQLDAFDLFRLQGRHVLMPNMSLACGADILTARTGDGRTWTTVPQYASCPACLSVPDLAAKAAAMQRRQA